MFCFSSELFLIGLKLQISSWTIRFGLFPHVLISSALLSVSWMLGGLVRHVGRRIWGIHFWPFPFHDSLSLSRNHGFSGFKFLAHQVVTPFASFLQKLRQWEPTSFIPPSSYCAVSTRACLVLFTLYEGLTLILWLWICLTVIYSAITRRGIQHSNFHLTISSLSSKVGDYGSF